MAPNPIPATAGGVCSNPPYNQFLQLQNFAPAVTWCLKYTKPQTAPPTNPSCPFGNYLCSILSNLEKSAPNIASTACSCIGPGPTVSVIIPKSTTPVPTTIKSTPKSSSASVTKAASSSKVASPSSSPPAVISKPSSTALVVSTSAAVIEPSSMAPVLSTSAAPVELSSTALVVSTSAAPVEPSSTAPVVSTSAAPVEPSSTAPATSSAEPVEPSSTAPATSTSDMPVEPSSTPPATSTAEPVEPSSTTPATSTSAAAACKTPEPSLSCSTVQIQYGDYGNVQYKLYYSGQGFTENPNNPGNDVAGRPPLTANFEGSLPTCDAIQQCATNAANDPNVYYGFDLHYLCSTGTWECTRYYNGGSDPAYFNVPNADVTAAYGYNIQFS